MRSHFVHATLLNRTLVNFTYQLDELIDFNYQSYRSWLLLDVRLPNLFYHKMVCIKLYDTEVGTWDNFFFWFNRLRNEIWTRGWDLN